MSRLARRWESPRLVLSPVRATMTPKIVPNPARGRAKGIAVDFKDINLTHFAPGIRQIPKI
jgi:hypothetical protein